MAINHLLLVSLSVMFTLQMDILIPYFRHPEAGEGLCKDNALSKIASSPMAKKSTVVFNPNNGPVSIDSNTEASYKACIKFLHDNGVKVLGYVQTRVGAPVYTGYRASGEVKMDIDIWFDKYSHISGVYLGDVANAWLQPYDESRAKVVEIYSSYINHVLAKEDKTIVLNSESIPFFELLENKGNRVSACIFNDHENWWAPVDTCLSLLWTMLKGSFENGPWCQYVPKLDEAEQLRDRIGKTINSSQLIALIQSVSNIESMLKRVEEAKTNQMGSLFITDKHNWSEFVADELWKSFIEAISRA